MKKVLSAAVAVVLLLGAPVSAQALCVSTSQANLRSGPGTQYKKIWEVYRYMPFRKVGASTEGDWYAVQDVDGDVNWIHSNLVTTQMQCTVVKRATVNVRKGPGTRYGRTKWSPAKQYDAFVVLQKKGLWVRVKNEWGEAGWIHTGYLWMD